MAAPDTLRYAKIPLTHGSGAIPALGVRGGAIVSHGAAA